MYLYLHSFNKYIYLDTNTEGKCQLRKNMFFKKKQTNYDNNKQELFFARQYIEYYFLERFQKPILKKRKQRFKKNFHMRLQKIKKLLPFLFNCAKKNYVNFSRVQIFISTIINFFATT